MYKNEKVKHVGEQDTFFLKLLHPTTQINKNINKKDIYIYINAYNTSPRSNEENGSIKNLH